MRTKIILSSAVLLLTICAFSTTSYAYVYSGHKWPSPAMGEPYLVNPNCTDPNVGTSQNILDAIYTAARAWNNEGNANFTFTYGGTTGATLPNDGNMGGSANGANEIMFVQAGQSYWYFLQNPNVIAVTWTWYNSTTLFNSECDLAFNDGTNPGYVFSAVGEPEWNEMDVWDIAAHEFGHYLSLGHPPVPTATMFWASSYGETLKRDLDPDDMAGIQYIYGVAPNYNPVLTNGYVTPAIGGLSTTYSYYVNYSDQNNGFGYCRAVVNGAEHDMTLYSGSPSNGTYKYETTLTYLPNGQQYGFAADDGQGGSDYLPPLGYFTGPTVIPVTASLTCSNPNVAQGYNLSYSVSVSNQNTSNGYNLYALCYVILPGGQQYGPVLAPSNFTSISAGQTLSYNAIQTVPVDAALGSYTYIVKVYYAGAVIANGTFPFTVGEPDRDAAFPNTWTGSWTGDPHYYNGPTVWDATCYGEPFPGEIMAAGSAHPAQYVLNGAYPNPFNPTTTISFTLPEASRVSLSIYDISGKLVTALVNGWREAGSHEVTFDGSNLSSGIYFCRMQVGQNTEMQKLVLMK